MHFILVFILLLFFASPAHAQEALPRQSDKTSEPALKSDDRVIESDSSEGSLLLGFDPRPCTDSLEGYLRYNFDTIVQISSLNFVMGRTGSAGLNN
jgi:hypothetical protein